MMLDVEDMLNKLCSFRARRRFYYVSKDREVVSLLVPDDVSCADNTRHCLSPGDVYKKGEIDQCC